MTSSFFSTVKRIFTKKVEFLPSESYQLGTEANDPNLHIKNYLRYYTTLTSPGYAVLLDGPWGCGKTHFVKRWMQDLKSDLKGESITYVSLFGLKDVAEFQAELLLASIPYAAADGVLRIGGTVGLELLKVGTQFDATQSKNGLLELASRHRTKFVVVDDLERCAIEPTSFLGFLNKLVEHHGVKLIVITNREKLTSEDSPKLFAAIEKLVGVSFVIASEPETALTYFLQEHAKPELDLSAKTFLELYSAFGQHNLRLLKHLVGEVSWILSNSVQTIPHDFLHRMVEEFGWRFFLVNSGIVGISDLEDFFGLKWKDVDGKREEDQTHKDLQDRLHKFHYGRSALQNSFYVEILANKRFDPKIWKKGLDDWERDADYWRRALGWMLTDNDFHVAHEEFKTRVETESRPGVVLHYYSIEIWRQKLHAPKSDASHFHDMGVEHLRRVFANMSNISEIRPYFDRYAFSRTFESMGYWADGIEEFEQLYQEFEKLKIQTLERLQVESLNAVSDQGPAALLRILGRDGTLGATTIPDNLAPEILKVMENAEAPQIMDFEVCLTVRQSLFGSEREVALRQSWSEWLTEKSTDRSLGPMTLNVIDHILKEMTKTQEVSETDVVE